MELIEADEVDDRHSIILSANTGGTITPNAPGNVLRVAPGSDETFTIIPDNGKIVDTVTVNGEAVTISDENQFTLTNISADQEIHVTFIDDSAADQLSFIVWNDNFASGEYTTAVIIDLGEGNEALGSALDKNMFTVSARNTTFDDLVAFEGIRNISRVYANDEPKVRGYLGKVHNSPDYQDGLESGRYIVVELEFYTEVGGNTTLAGSNSTIQNYNIVQHDDIVLTEGDPISYAVFKQENDVNPILDKFTAHTSEEGVNYARYLHKDENGDVLQGLPLYIYTHGFSRGGTQAHIDQKASMKSANGAVALMQRMVKDPDRYASHVLNISYSGGNAPQANNIKLIIDELVESELVDPNRIYVASFSMGGGVTTSLLNSYPGFFAAAAPMGIAGWPSVSTSEAHKDLAYWVFVNTYDSNASNIDNATADFAELTNARASRFDSNEALSWPYNQYDQPSQRPNMANDPPLVRYIAHEVEAAVLYNQITMDNPFTEKTWSIAPIVQSPNLPAWDDQYTDVFDWMFSQRKPGAPSAPSSFKATTGDGWITLNWLAPTDDGGSAILGYKVWYGDETPVDLDADETKYTFTGLTNGQEYTFKIVAVNEKGDSAVQSVKATPRKISPIVTDPSDGDNDNTGDTDTDPGSSEPTYTVDTPEGKPAVTDKDGNTTLPGGASVSLESGLSLNIQDGAELVLDDDTALGFIVVSSNPFNDVKDNNWFYNYVNSAYTFDLFDGTSSTTFSPGTSMTRAMFVQVLANLENVDRSDYTDSRFSDVADGQWYTAAVEWAAQNSIVNGISADLFDPNASMTREQMVVVLYNYMNYKGYTIPQSQAQSFADESEISSWALEAVQALQGIGIVTGKGNNNFDPKGTATRAEVAAVFVRLIEYLAK